MTKPAGVIIVEGESAYDALAGLNGWLEPSLRRMGIVPLRWNLRDPDCEAKFAAMRQNYALRCAIGFSGFGARVTVNGGESLWRHIRLPLISWLVDHPAYLIDNHRSTESYIAQVYSCTEFLDFQRRHVRSAGRIGHVDLGMPDLGPPRERQGDPVIILPKTGNDPQALEKIWQRLPALLRRIIYGAADEILAKGEGIAPTVIAVAQTEGVELGNDLPQLCFLAAQIDDYLRRLKSTGLMRAILSLPVTVYGGAWEHVDMTGARARFLGRRPYAEIVEASATATAVISINPNIDSTVHDRVWSSLAVGALPISDRNRFLDENFPMLRDYVFDWSGTGETEAISRVLDDPLRAREAAMQAHAHAASHLSMDCQIGKLLDFADLAGYLQPGHLRPQDFYIPAAA